MLEKIAARIGATRRPGAHSDIPAGVTYLTQFVVHDLDFPTRDALPRRNLLDLGLIYGDGPKHDSYAYQVPNENGAGRHLLRLGRTRPTANSPAWGAARDLPRTSCPHFDAKPSETRSEVLVPNSFSDFEPPPRADADALDVAAQRDRGVARRDAQPRRGLRSRLPDQPRHLPRGDPPRRARKLADAEGRRALPRDAREAAVAGGDLPTPASSWPASAGSGTASCARSTPSTTSSRSRASAT